MPTSNSLTYTCRSLSEIKEYVAWSPEKIRSLKINKRDVAFFDGIDIPQSILSSEASEAVVDIHAYSIEDFSDLNRRIILVDHLQDPRNLGAIVRSCAFFGVFDVIVPKDRQVLLSETTIRSAAGGFARVRLNIETNLNQVLPQLKKHGYWIVGTDMCGTDLRQSPHDFEKWAIVLGSEEKGVSQQILKKCDLTVAILGGGLESLNVSVACGIVLHHFCSPSLR